MTQQTIKLCKDCKFCEPFWWVPFDRFLDSKCGRFEPSTTIDPVSGDSNTYQYKPYCCSERVEVSNNRLWCGPEAKYFQPKQTLWSKLRQWLSLSH